MQKSDAPRIQKSWELRPPRMKTCFQMEVEINQVAMNQGEAASAASATPLFP
jgi:hypothetical protein